MAGGHFVDNSGFVRMARQAACSIDSFKNTMKEAGSCSLLVRRWNLFSGTIKAFFKRSALDTVARERHSLSDIMRSSRVVGMVVISGKAGVKRLADFFNYSQIVTFLRTVSGRPSVESSKMVGIIIFSAIVANLCIAFAAGTPPGAVAVCLYLLFVFLSSYLAFGGIDWISIVHMGVLFNFFSADRKGQ